MFAVVKKFFANPCKDGHDPVWKPRTDIPKHYWGGPGTGLPSQNHAVLTCSRCGETRNLRCSR